MTVTVGTIIKAAMRKATILAAGEALSAAEGQDALEAFEIMIDAWSTEELLIPIVSEVTFTLLANQPEYTIGIYPSGSAPTNHIETARPMAIKAAFIRDGSGTDYIQEIMDIATYSRISRKSNASRPSRFYVREGWPLNTILFEATPYADETLHLSVVQPLAGILTTANLTDVVNLPPGYKQALIYNLAVHLCPEWGKSIDPAVAVLASNGKKWIKRNNYQPIVLGMDSAITNNRKGIGTYIIEQGP